MSSKNFTPPIYNAKTQIWWECGNSGVNSLIIKSFYIPAAFPPILMIVMYVAVLLVKYLVYCVWEWWEYVLKQVVIFTKMASFSLKNRENSHFIPPRWNFFGGLLLFRAGRLYFLVVLFVQ